MVQLSGARDLTESTVDVRWLPTRSWLQNLCLTPCYANEMKSFTEIANKDWSVHGLGYGQQSCAPGGIFAHLRGSFMVMAPYFFFESVG